MRSLAVTQTFFYVAATITILTLPLGIPFILWMSIVGTLMLGLFINCLDILHQILLKSDVLNESLSYLREKIPYQMEN